MSLPRSSRWSGQSVCVVRLSFDHGYILTQTERMQAEDLQPTDDPLIRRGKRHQAYTERTCAGCHQPTWMRKEQRYCSQSCAMLAAT
jgi:hypothetical protein